MRVYADTSVFGGVFDSEFSLATDEFFDQARRGLFAIVISDVTVRELASSPEKVRMYFNEIKPICELVAITEAMIALSHNYLQKGIISDNYRDDALHVAAATVAGCPIIVSWNFKHIVHQKKIPLYNSVNILLGYSALQIYSPREVIVYDEE